MPAPLPQVPGSHPGAGAVAVALCPGRGPAWAPSSPPLPRKELSSQRGGGRSGEETRQFHTQTLRGKSSRPTVHAPLAPHKVSHHVSEQINPQSAPCLPGPLCAGPSPAQALQVRPEHRGSESERRAPAFSPGPAHGPVLSEMRHLLGTMTHTNHGVTNSDWEPEEGAGACALPSPHQHAITRPSQARLPRPHAPQATSRQPR